MPSKETDTHALQRLVRVMAMLRDSRHGCPWDRQQTMQSLTRYTLEEVYEVVDAIEQGSMDQVRDELGDLLFQIVFYARIGEEQGQFNLDDVADAITNKLLRRHPHVFPGGSLEQFGQAQALSAEDVVVNWEAIKQQERAQQRSRQDLPAPGGILDDIPTALPAMVRAWKLQQRAATVGFDWQSLEPVLAKIEEELDELKDAINGKHAAAVRDELGDLLFAVVNLARKLDLDPETSLRGTNRKFGDRFRFMEQAIAADGLQLDQLPLETLDQYWEQAKQAGH